MDIHVGVKGAGEHVARGLVGGVAATHPKAEASPARLTA